MVVFWNPRRATLAVGSESQAETTIVLPFSRVLVMLCYTVSTELCLPKVLVESLDENNVGDNRRARHETQWDRFVLLLVVAVVDISS